MRRIVSVVVATLMCVAAVGLSAGTASAATAITSPTANPFSVPANGSGNPVAFTVSASGFAAGANVFVEQCDGTPTTATGWDPSQNCDLGSSPAPVAANASGNVTFDATDANHAFTPFKGSSPQGIFNCLSPTQASPGNGLPDFRNCQVRVSTNNTAGTSDQVLFGITLPNAATTSAPNFTGTPTQGTVGSPYSFSFTGITGSPAPTFSMTPANVAGITLSAAGVLSGTPTAAGSTPITVTATNGIAPDAVKSFTLSIGATFTSNYAASEQSLLTKVQTYFKVATPAAAQHEATMFMVSLAGIIQTSGKPPANLGGDTSTGATVVVSSYTASEAAQVQSAATLFSTTPAELQRTGVRLVAYLIGFRHS